MRAHCLNPPKPGSSDFRASHDAAHCSETRLSEAVATHYGLDRDLHTIEHGPVRLSTALELTRAVYERQRAVYATAEEALADTMFGFSRGKHDFIEVSVNGRDNISGKVELPIRTGWGPFKTGFHDERTVRSLGDVETLLHNYFTLSHEDLRAALRSSNVR